jgi:hypothetical protein
MNAGPFRRKEQLAQMLHEIPFFIHAKPASLRPTIIDPNREVVFAVKAHVITADEELARSITA